MNNKTPKECKSNITLEDIRPYISCIHGYFGVPFDDSGFFMNNNEIAVSKEKYDGYFKKYAAMILGISEEEVCSKLTKKGIGCYYFCGDYLEKDLDVKRAGGKTTKEIICDFINGKDKGYIEF